MIPATFVGMALALGSLITMMLLEGTNPLAVVLLPPLLLVFGATFGAAVAGSTMSDLRKLGSWFRMAFGPERASPTHALVAQLVELATLARKEGMLPLENRARRVEDPFLRRGLQLAIDAVPAAGPALDAHRGTPLGDLGDSAVDLLARDEGQCAVVGDGLQHVVEGVGDDVLGSVDQVDHRVGVGLDALDRQRIDGEVLTVAAGHSDHGSGPSARAG